MCASIGESGGNGYDISVGCGVVCDEALFSTASVGNIPSPWSTKFMHVLAAILISTIIFFFDKILAQLIGRAVYLLMILLDALRSLFLMYEVDFLEMDFIIYVNIEVFVSKSKRNRSSQEANPDGRSRRTFKRMGRVSNKVNLVFGNIAAELTDIQPLRQEMEKFVAAPENARDYQSATVLHCLHPRTAKDADAARLQPLNHMELPGAPDIPAGSETLADISESVVADALNAINLGEPPLRDQKGDNDGVNIVDSQTLHNNTSRLSDISKLSPDLQQMKTPREDERPAILPHPALRRVRGKGLV
ncbi:hypothetical protein BKA65DRAFT_483392 [Rhexocercosporidium sp. MPI-PUGE-AT-0058]|nr:hypothetical protein BKA65DRAFT_483392 [Rhexocercosporidium sp. MPI-PUGE-AT-0058]